MPEYTVLAALAVASVLLVECVVVRTGVFRQAAYWVTIAIVLAMQVPVDGWLTKLSAPIVRYDPSTITGLRFPWDIPVEDFLFGYALVTAVLVSWQAARR